MLRIAVLVSGGGTNLQALIDAQNRGEIENGEITLCVSSKPAVYALERSRVAGIKAIVVERKPKKLQTSAQYAEELIQVLESEKIDLVVLAGFLVILDPSFIKKFPDKIINVHPSLIPSFCGEGYYGLAVHKAALDYGVKITGATVHYVSEIVDGGKIIMQCAVDVFESDTPGTLQKRVMEQAEWEILPKSLSLICKQQK